MRGGRCESWLVSAERPETWAWKRRSSDATRSSGCCKEQLHAAERERKLRVVAVTGQAGMGKSRLAWELEKYLDGLAGPQLYYWHQGRSPSYGEGVTYWALGEMVRRRARIAEGEGPDETREKLRATLDEFVPDAGRAALAGAGARRSARRRGTRLGSTRAALQRVEDVPRARRRQGPISVRLRGSAVGRHRPARLPRPPARLVARSADADRDPRPTRVPRASARISVAAIARSAHSTSSHCPTRR